MTQSIPGMTQSIPLEEAKQWLRDRIDEGARCPCCTQYAQVYRWSLYSTAAAMLIRLYRVGGTESFVESKSVKHPGQGGDATRLRFWNLVEQEPERRQDGGRSGWWPAALWPPPPPLAQLRVSGPARVVFPGWWLAVVLPLPPAGPAIAGGSGVPGRDAR